MKSKITTKIKRFKWQGIFRIMFVLFFLVSFQTMRSQDVGATVLSAPTISPMCGAKNQPVTITIYNYDVADVDFSVNNLTVNVIISATNTQNFSATVTSGTLAPGASMDVIVTTAADLSATDTYTFDAYTDLFDDLNGSNDAMSSVNIDVNALPTVTATADFSVCAGSDIILNGSGATTYVWDNSVTDNVAFTPISTTYNVIGTDVVTGCSNTASTTITVNALPNVTATPDFAVCDDGSSVILEGSGADDFTWDNSVTDGVPFVLAGPGTNTFNVIGTDLSTGCSNTSSTTVTVNALPNVTATPDFSACDGSTINLKGSGADNYSWDNGVIDNVPFTLTGTGTITFNVIGTDVGTGCSNTEFTDVTVNALPNVIATSDFAVCAGNTATLSGSGAAAYVWNNGVTNGTPFIPTATKTYIVTGTDANACSNTASTIVTVNTADTSLSLQGATFTANAIVGATYEWVDCGSNAVIAGETSQSFTASAPGSYALQITENGCTNKSFCYTILSTGIAKTSKYNISVYPNPTSGAVTIDLHAIVTGKVVVRDVLGQVVISQEIQAQQILVDLSKYDNGMFFINIETSASNHTFKITKN